MTLATRLHLAAIAGLLISTTGLARSPDDAPRRRESIDGGWRFHLGDPPGNAVDLRYDARPPVTLREDGAVFDAPPVEAERVATPPTALKPWIMPTGNAFIADPVHRYLRPVGDPGSGVAYVQPGFDDSGWQAVTLPHDWAIAGPFLPKGPYGGMGRLPSWGVGWYRRALAIPAADRGRSVFLDVDGAMSYAEVWVNGHLAGGWPYGYASWRVDLTPYLQPGGRNELAIRLDNPVESSRWYPGAGLYRNVWLTTLAPVHVAHWGTRITTPRVSPASAEVDVAVTIDNASVQAIAVTAATEIFPIDAADRRIGGAVARVAPAPVTIAANGSATVSAKATIERPRLWGPPPTQTPNRYLAVTTLRQGGKVVDREETRFGVRSLVFDANRGLLVNGERVMLDGVNQHGDLGALGVAWNDRAAARQLDILADMGVNAIRMSHNPPAPELLDMTDRRGILVLDEVFDAWRRRKTPLDFHLIFDDWHEQDLRAMIRRDRNHPSVILWSVGNEVGEQNNGAAGAAIARDLVAIAHGEDRSRPVMGSMNTAGPGSAFADAFDVVALNYQGAGVRTKPAMFAAFHAAYPGKMIFSSESAAAYSSRGQYQFPVPGGVSNPVRPGIGADDRHQVSAYELFAADFGGTPDRTWAAQDQNPYVAGEFVWTGFDYLGEPAPFYDQARSSYFGTVDLAGFPKDRFWEYKARWRPDVPFVHVLPHWTFPGREGQVTPVHAFTSGDEAELFVNGVSQGRHKRQPYEYRFRWDYVTYRPGEVTVVAYKNGKFWAKETVRTAGPPARLVLETPRRVLAADGRDLAFVAASLVDARGTLIPTDSRAVRVSVTGPAEVVATDNGDPTDMTAFPSTTRRLFAGRALAIVRARPGSRGRAVISVTADDVPAARLELAVGGAGEVPR